MQLVGPGADSVVELALVANLELSFQNKKICLTFLNFHGVKG